MSKERDNSDLYSNIKFDEIKNIKIETVRNNIMNTAKMLKHFYRKMFWTKRRF